MMTSRDPGELGIYGFRNRKDYAYDALTIANSHAVKVPTLWDLLGQAERNRSFWEYRSPTPQSRSPGWMVASFLTPDRNSQWTFPRRLSREIQQVASGYMIDIPNFRTDRRRRVGTATPQDDRRTLQTCTSSARNKGLGFFHDG